jgi:hypothetical protein
MSIVLQTCPYIISHILKLNFSYWTLLRNLDLFQLHVQKQAQRCSETNLTFLEFNLATLKVKDATVACLHLWAYSEEGEGTSVGAASLWSTRVREAVRSRFNRVLYTIAASVQLSSLSLSLQFSSLS